MLTPVQQIILTCLFIEPEDIGSFKRYLSRTRVARFREKDPVEFQRRSSERTRIAREKYPEHAKAQGRRYTRERFLRNPDALRAEVRVYAAGRRQEPAFRLLSALRIRVNKALRGGAGVKSARTSELLGCSVSELRGHLEKQFRPGMSWENYGPVWHVDHERPCASFDLTDPAQQRECFHYTNLQPLFAEENLKKGARLDYCK